MSQVVLFALPVCRLVRSRSVPSIHHRSSIDVRHDDDDDVSVCKHIESGLEISTSVVRDCIGVDYSAASLFRWLFDGKKCAAHRD